MNSLRPGDLFPVEEFGGSYTDITLDDFEVLDLGAPYRPPRSIHHSSERLDWETPDDLFEHYNGFFKFDLDAAATMVNRKCAEYLGPDHWEEDRRDALTTLWGARPFPSTVWLNPPYGRKIGKFIAKARDESEGGRAIVVCLVPARVDTAWWHREAWKAAEIHFLAGRVTFVGAVNSAPFPSAVLIFDGTGPKREEHQPHVRCKDLRGFISRSR